MFKYLFYLALLLLPFSTNPGGNSIVVSYGIPFFILLFIYFLFHKNYRISRSNLSLVIPALIWIGCILSFSLISSSPLTSLFRSSVFLLGGLIFTMLLSERFSNALASIGILKKSIMIFGFTLATYYLVQFVIVSSKVGIQTVLLERYVGGAASLPWGATNVISSCLILALSVASIDNTRSNSKFSLITIIVILLAIGSTISRTAILLSIILMFSVIIVGRRSRTIIFLSLIIAGAILIGLQALSSNDSYIQILVADRLNSESLATLNTRSDIWQTIISHQIYLNPIGYYGMIVSGNQSGHSIFFTTLAEQGIIGVFLLIMFWIFLSIRLISMFMRYRNQKSIWITAISFLIITIDLLIEDPYFSQPYALVFWLTLAFLFIEKPYSKSDFQNSSLSKGGQHDLSSNS